MRELKPCPFCGTAAKTEISYAQYGGNELFLRASVYCQKCGCAKSVKFDAMHIDFDSLFNNCFGAEDAWNERAE